MLNKTFVHIPGIGYMTERRLWERGIRSWSEALGQGPCGSFSSARWGLLQDHCRQSIASLEAEDHCYFARTMASRDQWRACESFRGKIGYLDIETDGGTWANSITVIGVYDGQRMKSFVRGENLQEFAEDIERYALLVTFNGATFDLPILRRAFPHAAWDHLHADLRFMLGRLGFRGGLKQIERDLGLARDDDINGLSGEDAITLWREYRRGSAEALELLLRYNEADVLNMEHLLNWALPRLQAHVEGCPAP